VFSSNNITARAERTNSVFRPATPDYDIFAAMGWLRDKDKNPGGDEVREGIDAVCLPWSKPAFVRQTRSSWATPSTPRVEAIGPPAVTAISKTQLRSGHSGEKP
jgi:hypothetical protein